MVENLRIFISESFFLSLIFSKKTRQGISCSIYFSLTIIDREVVLRELLGSADLTAAQALCIYEWTEVIIVNTDKSLVIIAYQVVALSLKSPNNGWELLIVRLIQSLSVYYFLKKKATKYH